MFTILIKKIRLFKRENLVYATIVAQFSIIFKFSKGKELKIDNVKLLDSPEKGYFMECPTNVILFDEEFKSDILKEMIKIYERIVDSLESNKCLDELEEIEHRQVLKLDNRTYEFK